MGRLSIFHRKVGPLKTDSECSVSSVASYLTIDVGSWKESISGYYIKIQQWRLLGSNIRFVCGGRLMLIKGKSLFFLAFLVSQMMIFLSVFGFFEIWKNTQLSGKMVFPLICVLFGFYSIVHVFYVVFTDPGILAPEIHDPDKEFLTLRHIDDTSGISFNYDNMLPDIIEVDGEKVERFYCLDCRAYREFRTYHCPFCLVCIERYDHHCHMLGMCIGRRNYGYFFKFLWSMAFSLLGMIIYSMTNLITFWIADGFLIAASKSPTSFVFLGGLVFPPCGSAYLFLLFYNHLCFIWSDTTLHETKNGLKGLAKPFKQNFCQAVSERISHIWNVVFTKPPSPNIYPHKYLHVRAMPNDEEANQFVNKHHKALLDIYSPDGAHNNSQPSPKLLLAYSIRKFQGQTLVVRGHVTLKRLRIKHSWITTKPKRSTIKSRSTKSTIDTLDTVDINVALV